MPPPVFLPIPVPAGDGVGAAVDVSAMVPAKRLVVAEVGTGISLLEGSQDGSHFFGVDNGRIDRNAATPGPIDLNLLARFLRVRRSQAVSGAAPVLTIGADTIGGNTFGALTVPTVAGVGPVLSATGFGPVKTFAIGGTLRAGFVAVEGTQDGATFNTLAYFPAPLDPGTARAITVRGFYSAFRVVRGPVLAGDDPSIQYGEGEEIAPPNLVEYVQLGNVNGYTFANLNGNADLAYTLVFKLIKVSAGNGQVRLIPNGIGELGNIIVNQAIWDGATLTMQQVDNIGTVPGSNGFLIGIAKFVARANGITPRGMDYTSTRYLAGPTDDISRTGQMFWDNIIDNMTSLLITVTGAANLTGSELWLYRGV
jgi:hypothetical protein